MRLWKGLIFAAVLSAAAASAQEPVLLLAVASDRSVPFDASKGPRALYLKFPKGDLLSGVIPGDIVLVQPAQASELAQDAPKLRLVPDTARQRAKADPSSEWRFSDPCGGFWRGDVSADGGSLRLTPFAAAYVIRGPLTANPDCSLLRNSKELAVFLKQNGYALSSGKPLTQERVFRELSLTEAVASDIRRPPA